MNRSRTLIVVAAALLPVVGCAWLDKFKTDTAKDALPKAQEKQFVAYINERATRFQTLNDVEVRMVAKTNGVPLPALRGELNAEQPRNFRLRGKGALVDATADLGSNGEQFWVYVNAPTQKPTFMFASHSDFEAGKAKLPGGIPFEPDWVMQALGMAILPQSNQYSVHIDQKARTYTLSWPAQTPQRVSVVKEIVFDGDPASEPKPQIKKHVVRDTKGNVICAAEIKQVKDTPTGLKDGRGHPIMIQHPTVVVLRWEDQKFEMKLELERGTVNKPFTQKELADHFTRPNYADAKPIDLARYDVPLK